MSNVVGVCVSEGLVSFQTINCSALQTLVISLAFWYPNLGACLFSYFLVFIYLFIYLFIYFN